MSTVIRQVQLLGQSIWYDNIRRGLLTSGELQRLVELGVSGVTSNPTILEKAVAGSSDYDEALLALARDGKSTVEVYESLAIEDLRGAADVLRPIYDRTDGADGYACLEVSPALAYDTDGTIAEGRRLFAALDRPNVMVKVPATSEGIPAIRRLIGEGINVNVTLIFSLETYRRVMGAYIAGLEDLARSGGNLSRVASVASFFVSRVDTAVDALLEERIRADQERRQDLLGEAAIANAKLAYVLFKETFGGDRFAALRARGARVQRPLWASTGTKNPAYSDVLYIETLIGADTVNTVPPETLSAFLDHGHTVAALEQGVPRAEEAMQALDAAGISMDDVTAALLVDGVRLFADSFEKLLANIEDKRSRLVSREYAQRGASLGSYLPEVEATLNGLRRQDVLSRIWRRDHTVWKPDPSEIANRLGWLTVTDLMCEQVPALRAFAGEVRDTGFRHVVLMGMGGSSLGPEVLRQTFGSAPGYPQVIVLDSTVPAWVRGVAESVDPALTLFLVSSKSGGTLESLSLYRYFRDQVDRALGAGRAGHNFVAITDPGTSLERLAREHRFRRVFLNPPDIGGRYSVLSYFGMVPASLAGLDIATLLDRADCMREGCASCVSALENPGAWLGAIIGGLALKGRDKLTLVTSPSVASFGLWAEQLIAESTGKEGKGIVPVAGEPLLSPVSYGNDRLFVHLRLEGADNAAVDAAMARLIDAGQPLVRLELRDRYDLGAEFFRWELATAVAGAILGINPFDQPNVEEAKQLTGQVLNEYQRSGKLPDMEASGSLRDLLAKARPGDYLAIMAYVRQTPEMDQAFAELRSWTMERYRIPVTLGYGPRFLHSTGQIHKGGPDSGLFLQVTAGDERDLPIPGEGYTFGMLAAAQAQGDLQALQAQGRRVARIELETGDRKAIRKLFDELE